MGWVQVITGPVHLAKRSEPYAEVASVRVQSGSQENPTRYFKGGDSMQGISCTGAEGLKG